MVLTPLQWPRVSASMAKYKVANKGEVRPGEMVGRVVEDRELLIANVHSRSFAIDGRCSRRCGKLWQGRLSDYVVECPNHGAAFDVRSGKVVSSAEMPEPATRDLRSYEVTVDETKCS